MWKMRVIFIYNIYNSFKFVIFLYNVGYWFSCVGNWKLYDSIEHISTNSISTE